MVLALSMTAWVLPSEPPTSSNLTDFLRLDALFITGLMLLGIGTGEEFLSMTVLEGL